MLTQTRPSLDPTDLAQAIERQVREPDFDYRTRLLVHNSNLSQNSQSAWPSAGTIFSTRLLQSAKHNWYVLSAKTSPIDSGADSRFMESSNLPVTLW